MREAAGWTDGPRSPLTYQIAEMLQAIGWTSPCDAQWTHLESALPLLRDALYAEARPTREGGSCPLCGLEAGYGHLLGCNDGRVAAAPARPVPSSGERERLEAAAFALFLAEHGDDSRSRWEWERGRTGGTLHTYLRRARAVAGALATPTPSPDAREVAVLLADELRDLIANGSAFDSDYRRNLLTRAAALNGGTADAR